LVLDVDRDARGAGLLWVNGSRGGGAAAGPEHGTALSPPPDAGGDRPAL